jgi:hypothetical protein
MQTIKINKIFVIISFLILSSCGNFSVYNVDKYNQKSQWFLLDAIDVNKKNFTICSELFAKTIDLDYKATLMCSSVNQKMEKISVNIFNKCYIFKPIANNYKCV